jgi:hypothetical protein
MKYTIQNFEIQKKYMLVYVRNGRVGWGISRVSQMRSIISS